MRQPVRLMLRERQRETSRETPEFGNPATWPQYVHVARGCERGPVWAQYHSGVSLGTREIDANGAARVALAAESGARPGQQGTRSTGKLTPRQWHQGAHRPVGRPLPGANARLS